MQALPAAQIYRLGRAHIVCAAHFPPPPPPPLLLLTLLLPLPQGAKGFGDIVAALLRDVDSGAFPALAAADFGEQFKAYLKGLGKELGLKGKGLFHPVRLALTGRMSGPDVGDQLALLQAAAGVVAPSFPLVGMEARVAQLRAFDLASAKTRAEAAAVVHAAKAAEAEAAKVAAAAAAAAAVDKEVEVETPVDA